MTAAVSAFAEDAHTAPGGRRGTAVLSTDRTRRYLLTRRWDGGPLMAWLMLNPSTADARTDDATITRCVRRARDMGTFGGIAVVNLFSLRAADPRELRACPDPVGPANDSFIIRTCQTAVLVVVAWGAHGAYLGRGAEVTSLLARSAIRPACLGVTGNGQPRHPGRMAYAAPLVPFTSAREEAGAKNLRMTAGTAQLAGTAAPAPIRHQPDKEGTDHDQYRHRVGAVEG